MNYETLHDYCTGCGLCHSVEGLELDRNAKGYSKPVVNIDTDKRIMEFADKVCPAGRTSLEHLEAGNIWGHRESMHLGYSSDASIRHDASSGGVLSALSLFLLETGRVDGIIQTKVSQNSQIETVTVVSTTRDEVLRCCGSRYAISSPLRDILQLTEPGKRYAFIGKPCDVTALANYMELNPKLYESIVFLFAFFCAGLPSQIVNRNLLNKLGCTEETCAKLTYRGDGWPGKTTAVHQDGQVTSMEYAESWGGILGRDVLPMCRFCMDGIGERADVSCGDAWYLLPDGTPDFSENEGRNVVFGRNDRGKELLEAAVSAGYLILEEFGEERILRGMQTYQYDRRATMWDKVLAMKLFRRATPDYSLRRLRTYSIDEPFKVRFRIFGGTVKRILKGRM